MVWVVAAGMTSQVIPWVGVLVSVQSIFTVEGSLSATVSSTLAVNCIWHPVISTGTLTGGVTLVSVMVSVILHERVAPRSSVSAAPPVQAQVSAGVGAVVCCAGE